MPAIPLLALLFTLVLGPLAGQAQTIAPSAAEPDTAAPNAAEAARILVDALEDPASRAALIAQLRAAASAAPEAEPAEGFDAALTRAVADRTRAVAEGLSEGAAGFFRTVTDWNTLAARAADVNWRAVADDALAIGVVMAVTFGLYAALRYVTRGLRTRAAGLPGPRTPLRKVLGLAAIGAFEVLLIVLAWGAGYALALWGVGGSGEMDLRQSFFLNAFLVVGLGRLVLRLATAPRRPELRLIPLGDDTAQELDTQAGRILAVLGYGMLLAAPITRGAFGVDAAAWISLGAAALAAFMALGMILHNRERLRNHLMARAAARRTEGVVKGAMVVLAQIWHLLAIAYVAGLFVVWMARPADSLGFMVAATLQSALAIAIAAIVMVGLSRRIAGGVRLSQQVGTRLPMLEARLNALVPNGLSLVRLLLFVAVLAILLDIWGLFALGDWLSGETGRRVVQSLLSAGLVLVVCAAVWVTVASWIEYKITPHDGRIVRAREQTLFTLLRNAFAVVMVVMAGMLTLSAIGINIAPLLAGAGVIGLAIGFGAQRMVQDIITGVFIQLENAMNTGDVVTAGPVTGSVEKLTIRSVGIRDLSGTFHLVPFSSVDTVANFTKDYAWHVAEIGVGYSADTGEAKRVMCDAFDELRATEHGRSIIADFDMQGVIALAESAVTIRGRIKTVAGAQWSVGCAYTEIVKRRFDEAGIEIPYPNVTLHMPPGAKPEKPGPRLLRSEADSAEENPQPAKLSR